ncbi:hypothetical protein ACFQDD_11075, partial [Halorubrum pallidum]
MSYRPYPDAVLRSTRHDEDNDLASFDFNNVRTDGISITDNDFLNPDSDLAKGNNAYHAINNGNEVGEETEGPIPSTFIEDNGEFDGAVRYEDDVVGPDIQPILDGFVEESADEEQTVELGGGNYTGGFEITADNLTIDGSGMENTVIGPDANYPEINATNVTIRDLQIDSGGGLALRVPNSGEGDGLRIENVMTRGCLVLPPSDDVLRRSYCNIP